MSETISDQFLLAARVGIVAGHSLIHKFGSNPNVGTTLEDVWEQGGLVPWMTSSELVNVVSSDTINDIASGSGARSVLISGLDEDFTPASEIVNLAATATSTTNKFRRIQTAKVLTTGTYGGTNLGAITITGATSSNVHALLIAGVGRTSQSHYTIPRGKTGVMLRTAITMDTGKVIDVNMHRREDADIISAPFTAHIHSSHWAGLDAPTENNFNAGMILKEMTDVWFDAVVPSTSASVDIDYDLLLIDNEYLR